MGLKILSELDHIRTRPGMYIGDTETPQHLLVEVLDNSLDEVINNYATKLDVNITNNVVSISDNGRGIPIQKLSFQGEERDSIEILCTKLFSGSKFDTDTYQYLVGMHGVGLVVVNALSDWLKVEVKKDKKVHVYNFSNGKLVDIKIEDIDNSWSTRISFKPAKKYFTSLDFDTDSIFKRLQLVASIHNCDITFNNNEVEKKELLTLIKEQLDLEPNQDLFKVSVEGKVANQKMQVESYFTYDLRPSAPISSKLLGVVNLRNCNGIYISNMATVLGYAVEKIIPKTYIINKSDAIIRLRQFTVLKVSEPKFDSQTKERYVGPPLKEMFPKLQAAFEKEFKESQYLQDSLKAINDYKILRKTTSATKKTTKKISVDSNLKDCLKIPGKRIFIVEGQSAGNPLSLARDVNTEAVYPLQGKLINGIIQRMDKVMENKQVKYLFEALGMTKIGDYFESRYEKIVLMSDADPDGNHINTLILTLLYQFTPFLIKEERVQILLTPLYGLVNKDHFEPLYVLPEKIKSGYELLRFKGLGEMTGTQMKKILETAKYYDVKWQEDFDLKELFDNIIIKRKLLEISDNEINLQLYGTQ